MKQYELSKFKSIVFLTGAGISVSSGLPTYRGSGGLWEGEVGEELARANSAGADPELLWKFWSDVRKKVQTTQPTKAHKAIATLPSRYPQPKVTVITQNIDGLHIKSGSENVIELHGSIMRSRCNNRNCQLEPFEDLEIHSTAIPSCHLCSSLIRPDIVLFNEELPAEADWLSKRALRDCDLFIAVGTSGTVSPACRFVNSAKYAGAKTVLANLEPMEPPNPSFDSELLGPADEILPLLLQ